MSDLIEAVASDIQEAEYTERSDDLGPLTEPLMVWHREAAEAAVLRTLAALARRWPALKRSLARFASDHGLEFPGTGESDPIADASENTELRDC